MDIIFLGTSCMVPTKERNHQGIFIAHKEEGILIDCGEGIQRQFRLADIKPTKISTILISHWHGDHVLGLPGLLQTINASGYEKKLRIFGPKGTKEHFDHMFRAFSFVIGFEHEIKEITEATIDLKDLTITSLPLDHGVPCLGYALQEKDKRKIKIPVIKKLGVPVGPLLGDLQDNKPIIWKGKTVSPNDATFIVKGKKVAVILDTALCNNAIFLANNADLLISEAVYEKEHYVKSEEYKHLTAEQAATLAAKANAKKLIITHFSQRYKTTERLVEEAAAFFSDVLPAHDFMRFKL